MLYKNRSDRNPALDKPSHNPAPTRERKLAEAEITSQTHLILHELRRQLGRTQLQTSLDRYITVIGPRFAYDNMGADRIPIQWKPGLKSFNNNWWYTLQLEVVSRLVMTYFEVIREGTTGPWEKAIARLREMLKTGIHEYKLAPIDKVSFSLMTQSEWDTFKQNQQTDQQKRADKIDKLDRLNP